MSLEKIGRKVIHHINPFNSTETKQESGEMIVMVYLNK